MTATKTYRPNGTCLVTFSLPASAAGGAVALCGEFNDWSPTAAPLTRRKDGRFSTTVTVPVGRRYRYRYLVDSQRWENDWEADDYQPNEFGGDDSVLDLTTPPHDREPHKASTHVPRDTQKIGVANPGRVVLKNPRNSASLEGNRCAHY